MSRSSDEAIPLPDPPLKTHVVRDASSWPAPVLDIVKPLATAPDDLETALASLPETHPFLLALSACSRHFETQQASEHRLPHLGPDSHRHAIGTLINDMIFQAIPSASAHHIALYTPLFHVRQPHDSAAWLWWQHGFATSIVTAFVEPVMQASPLRSVDDPESPEMQTHRELSDDREQVRGGSSACYGTHSSSPCISHDPFTDVHIIFPPFDDEIPVVLFCIATHDEIHDLTASALLQRQAFGISEPLLALTFAPNSWMVQLVVGWLSAGLDGTDAEPCMAHAPLNHAEDHSTGVFDLSNKASLRVLAGFLLSTCREPAGCIARAKSSLVQDPEYRPWQAKPPPNSLRRRRDRYEAIISWRNSCEPEPSARSDTRSDCDPSNAELPNRLTSICEGSAEDAESHHSLDEFEVAVQLTTISADGKRGCTYPFAYPENGRWRNISSDPSIRQAPAESYENEFLFENKIEPYAWPPPDFPDDLAGVDVLKAVCEDYLYSIIFAPADGERLDTLLPPELSAVWQEYTDGLAWEQEMCTQAGLAPFKKAATPLSDILAILPTIKFVCDRIGLQDGHDVRSRERWNTLLDLCLKPRSTDADEVHVRSECRVPFARNAYWDRVHGAPDSCSVSPEDWSSIAEGTHSLQWAYTSATAAASDPEWLVSTKVRLANRMQKLREDRSATAALWRERQATLDHGHFIDLRVLDCAPAAPCDTVAFVSIPDVFNVDPADCATVHNVMEFSVIGSYLETRSVRYATCHDQRTEEHTNQKDADSCESRLRSTPKRSRHPSTPSAAGSSSLSSVSVDEQVVRGDAQRHREERNSVNDLLFPCLWLEDLMFGSESYEETRDRARFRIDSSIRFCAALGIYNLPVFALVIHGTFAMLYCGWGTKSDAGREHTSVDVHIADYNCPNWNLRDTSEAIRFCAFLFQLRHVHVPKIRQAFEARRQDFVRAWASDPDDPRFQWTLAHQQNSPLAQNLRRKRDEENDQLRNEYYDAMDRRLRDVGNMGKTVRLEDVKGRMAEHEASWTYELDDLLERANCLSIRETLRTADEVRTRIRGDLPY